MVMSRELPMTKPTRSFLLDPVFPAPANVPRLSGEMRALAELGEHRGGRASGTWRLGTHSAEEDDEPRFATSDTEAPTVRPGSLHAAQAG